MNELPKSNRRGAVLICVLVCLGVASIITLGTLKTSLAHRRELQRHWQMEQTQWVLEAGWRRGLQSRLADNQYTGEVWQLDGVLSNDLNAMVQITIDTADASQGDSELMVSATLQTKDPVPIVTRRSYSWKLPNSQTVNDSLDTEASQ